jgi:hypothetical protein
MEMKCDHIWLLVGLHCIFLSSSFFKDCTLDPLLAKQLACHVTGVKPLKMFRFASEINGQSVQMPVLATVKATHARTVTFRWNYREIYETITFVRWCSMNATSPCHARIIDGGDKSPDHGFCLEPGTRAMNTFVSDSCVYDSIKKHSGSTIGTHLFFVDAPLSAVIKPGQTGAFQARPH